jgi:hypothetical protein
MTVPLTIELTHDDGWIDSVGPFQDEESAIGWLRDYTIALDLCTRIKFVAAPTEEAPILAGSLRRWCVQKNAA